MKRELVRCTAQKKVNNTVSLWSIMARVVIRYQCNEVSVRQHLFCVCGQLTLCWHLTKLLNPSLGRSKSTSSGPTTTIDRARCNLFEAGSDFRAQDNPDSEPTPDFLSTVNSLSHSIMSYAPRPKAKGRKERLNDSTAVSRAREEEITKVMSNAIGEGAHPSLTSSYA